MEKNERIVEGDERTLVLFEALLNQGMPLDDIFVFLRLKDKEQFLERNGLTEKLSNLDELKIAICEQIEKLAKENRKK